MLTGSGIVVAAALTAKYTLTYYVSFSLKQDTWLLLLHHDWSRLSQRQSCELVQNQT